jgi:predicted DNA-binding protein YlxM (UPF0122 family)
MGAWGRHAGRSGVLMKNGESLYIDVFCHLLGSRQAHTLAWYYAIDFPIKAYAEILAF